MESEDDNVDNVVREQVQVDQGSVANVKKGRPKKYETEEERKAA